MTLILKVDLDMAKMYLHTKNEVSMWSSSKVIAWTDRQTQTDTHRHDWKHNLPAFAGGNDNKIIIVFGQISGIYLVSFPYLWAPVFTR